MAPLNTRTAAVIDPILSTHARGYRNSEFVGHLLFPRVSIPNRSMHVLKFGKEDFRMVNTRRAPGADKKRIDVGYAADVVSLVQNALEGKVPAELLEEAAKVPGINLGRNAINQVMNIIDLGHEYEGAQLARTAANYATSNRVTLAGSDRWTSATSTPDTDVDEAKDVIRRMIGRYPNTLVVGPSAFKALKRHPKIKEQFKYTSSASITVDMLATYFDLDRVIVGKAVYLPDGAADSSAASDVWGDDAVLAYVPATGDDFMVPAYGYTYELNGYPQVRTPYFWEPNDSWIYPTTAERRTYLTGAEGGFLFQNSGAS